VRLQARFTAIKGKRVNIRLSSADLLALQAKTLSEGMPWQTHTWQIQKPAVQPACKGCATSLTPNAAHTRDTVSNLGSLPGLRAL